MITLSTGTKVDLVYDPAALCELTKEEYAELLKIVRLMNERAAA